jgi:hypothetical protein
MCVAKGSVENFINSDVSETPFGNAPYKCENPICKYYHVDSAVCTEVRSFNSRAVGFFHCTSCGMKYKITKAKSAKSVTVILDYGHLWKNELIRCSQDKNITLAKTEEILKCHDSIIMKQKKKLGLLRPQRYDVSIGPEAYYKAKVIELCEEYGEVTYALLQEKVPGAYDYLGDHYNDWLRERMTTRWETGERREFVEYAQKKIQEAIAHITANPPNRQISYGYIAEITGLTRDNLRSNSKIRAFVEGFVESREDWQRRKVISENKK